MRVSGAPDGCGFLRMWTPIGRRRSAAALCLYIAKHEGRLGAGETPRPPRNAEPSERRREGSHLTLKLAAGHVLSIDDSLLGTGQRDGKDRIGPLHSRGSRKHSLCCEHAIRPPGSWPGRAHQLCGNMWTRGQRVRRAVVRRVEACGAARTGRMKSAPTMQSAIADRAARH